MRVSFNITHDLRQALSRIKEQAATGNFRVTQHAAVEMDEEDIVLSDVLAAISSGQILENYPEHRRGACCLLGGTTAEGSPIHVVCTTGGTKLILITVYKPKLPKWRSSTERNR